VALATDGLATHNAANPSVTVTPTFNGIVAGPGVTINPCTITVTLMDGSTRTPSPARTP